MLATFVMSKYSPCHAFVSRIKNCFFICCCHCTLLLFITDNFVAHDSTVLPLSRYTILLYKTAQYYCYHSILLLSISSQFYRVSLSNFATHHQTTFLAKLHNFPVLNWTVLLFITTYIYSLSPHNSTVYQCTILLLITTQLYYVSCKILQPITTEIYCTILLFIIAQRFK